MDFQEITPEISLRFSRFHRAMQSKDFHEAVGEFYRLSQWLRHLSLSRQLDIDLGEEFYNNLYLGWLDIMWRTGMDQKMLETLDHYLTLDPEDQDVQVWRATVLFQICRFDEAREELTKYANEDWDDPRIYYYLAGLAERDGDDEEARRLYYAASELDEIFQPPLELSVDDALELFKECLHQCPEPINEAVSHMRIEIQDLPTNEDLLASDPPMNPWALGSFYTIDVDEELAIEMEFQDDPLIVLYRKNIERIAHDKTGLFKDLKNTLLYDVGLYIGLSETELREIQLSDPDNDESKN